MQDLLDTIAQAAVVAAGRIVLVALVVVALLVAYRIFMAVVLRIARGAGAAPVPGEADLPADQRAIAQATRARRLETLVLFARRLGWAVVVATAVLASATILVPEVIAAMGALGVALGAAVGAALGFGAQQLVRDYLNGILILGENPFSVGDVVSIAAVRGTVEEVGLRRTTVRDSDGTLHSVPNGQILVASNFTRTFARVNERFVVAPGTDIGRATQVLDEACAELAAAESWTGRFLEAPRVVRVEAVGAEPGVPILVSAKVRPGEQWEVADALRRHALDALAAARIDLAAGRTYLVGARQDAAPADEAEAGAEYT